MNQSTVDLMIQYEQGDLPDEAIIDLFRELVNTGMINYLQGHYQRTASALIADGWIDAPDMDA